MDARFVETTIPSCVASSSYPRLGSSLSDAPMCLMDQLPWPLLEAIMSFAASDPSELCRMERVCKTWWVLIREADQDEGECGSLFPSIATTWWDGLPSEKKLGMGERLGRRQYDREACCRLYRHVVLGELMTSLGLTRESVRGRVEKMDGVSRYLQGRRAKRDMVAAVRAAMPGVKETAVEPQRAGSWGEEDLTKEYDGLWMLERIKSSLRKTLLAGAW